jgi:2-phospho-L-lactate/phosphoenolpyruvate guanylyltransferase
MSKAILAAIPIKPFGVAKRRLSDRLDAPTRSHLGRMIAARTAGAATDAGALVAVVTADPGVASWARGLGYLVIDEDRAAGKGLNGAATSAVIEARRRQRPWAVIHADLPLVTPGALAGIFERCRIGSVVVPSYNGGTNIIAGNGSGFRFSYGPGSFHRHVAQNQPVMIRTDPRLALDLDTTEDLDRALQLPTGRWLRELIG